MFTVEERDRVRDRVLELAHGDSRVTAGALIGSSSVGAEDEWSDIDITFGVADDVSPDDVLRDWTALYGREFGVLDHFDLRAGASVYRVFLLPSGLEIDVSVTPQREFSLRGSRFRTLFGEARRVPAAPPPVTHDLIGMGWHHILHAHSCIERSKPWQAEYWISALRDYTLALASVRLGEDAVYARGVDRLPASVTAPLADALVRSLDAPELRRALAVATTCFLTELDACDPALGERLRPLLLEFGGAHTPDAMRERASLGD